MHYICCSIFLLSLYQLNLNVCRYSEMIQQLLIPSSTKGQSVEGQVHDRDTAVPSTHRDYSWLQRNAVQMQLHLPLDASETVLSLLPMGTSGDFRQRIQKLRKGIQCIYILNWKMRFAEKCLRPYTLPELFPWTPLGTSVPETP